MAANPKRILLLSMPYGALERQALGLSLLKAELAERGVSCDVRYLTFAFADLLGPELYQWAATELPHTAFAGEWTFTEALYGSRPTVDAAYVEDILRGQWQLEEHAIRRLQQIRSRVPLFLDYCMEAIDWTEYALVGFTSTFEQNLASLALARRIKAAHPGVAIAFGGANWEGEMGLELHRNFEFVDYAFSGEADESFPPFAADLLASGSFDAGRHPGLVYRRSGTSVSTGPARPVQAMDSLPEADFSDYFRDLERSTAASTTVPVLLLETSRGCWWGAKSHCKFCGLNGGSMAFRSKSPERVIDELCGLVEQWKTEYVEVVDNILDMKYFQELLPAIAALDLPLQLFWEVKANLSKEQVKLLRQAGVRRIQPGLESMSDHILQLMGKGTTALRNIQLLKWCRQYGVGVDWNLLYGFPGETEKDYADMHELLPAIRFLEPPAACGPIRLDRFSPYHQSPGDHGLVNVRPMASYRYLYPFDDDSLLRLAYYFDFDYADGVDPKAVAGRMIHYAEAWKQSPGHGSLTFAEPADGRLILMDSRDGSVPRNFELHGLEKEAYRHCDQMRTAASVCRHLRLRFPDEEFSDPLVSEFLDSLVANRLMVSDDRHYLSLAIPAAAIPAKSGLRAHVRSQGASPLQAPGETMYA